MDATDDTILETPAAVAPPADRDVACPLCEYNLRGLVEPRCPECGYAFEWDELLDPTRRRHPYLFEHHPRRNIVSFVSTLLGGLMPRRFWRTLSPAMPSRPARLAIYFLLTTGLLVVVPLASFVRDAYDIVGEQRRYRAYHERVFQDPNHSHTKLVIATYGSTQAFLAAQYPPVLSAATFRRVYDEFQFGWSTIHVIFAILAWPWLTFGALMIFRWSMRRAKVRTGQVARCVVYGFDWGFWLVPLVTVFLSDQLARDLIGLQADRAMPIVAAVVFAAYGTYRLGAAYANYLRFEHPYETAMATQLIVLLVVVAFALN